MTINIEWQDQFGHWKHFQTKQNQMDTFGLLSLLPNKKV
jgi:hypothetical protein